MRRDVEHNYLHHYELGEGSDPDLLERNAHNVRISKLPKALKVRSTGSERSRGCVRARERARKARPT
jgi:hypothetical protein